MIIFILVSKIKKKQIVSLLVRFSLPNFFTQNYAICMARQCLSQQPHERSLEVLDPQCPSVKFVSF